MAVKFSLEILGPNAGIFRTEFSGMFSNSSE